MRLHLTDLAVARLKEPGEYHDDSTLGFAVRVGKNRKTWFVQRGRQRLRTNIGQYPALSLADARAEAKRLLTQPIVKYGRLSFEEAAKEYKASIAHLRPHTQRDYKQILGNRLLPVLGKKKLSELTYEDFIDITKKMKPSMGAHVLALARIFLNWCVRPPRRYIPHSPLEGVQVRHAKPRKRILDENEQRVVWRAAAAEGYPYGSILQLLAVTGQRRGEIAALRRPWINEMERTITLPDGLTKNSKEHTFPYGDMAAAILEAIPRRNDTDLLFPSIRSADRPISGWSKYKKNLGDGLPPWRLHDLRRTYRSTHGKIGTPREIAERLINHAAGVQTDVEAVYDVFHYLPQMREAVANFENHFTALLAA